MLRALPVYLASQRTFSQEKSSLFYILPLMNSSKLYKKSIPLLSARELTEPARAAHQASFPFSLGAKACLASVSVDDVRDVIEVGSVRVPQPSEVPDAKVLKMIKHAEVTLELIR
jgi:hypothetical protein